MEHQDPVYRFIYLIMTNQLDGVKAIIDEGNIYPDYPILEPLLIYPYSVQQHLAHKVLKNLTPLSLAAILGRTDIFRFLLAKGGNPGKMVTLWGLKAYIIEHSVNECLLMSEIFRWYKSEQVAKVPTRRAKELIDLIILASRKSPSLISRNHLLEYTIRVTWYWDKYKEIMEDPELLRELIPLNPPVFKELFDF